MSPVVRPALLALSLLLAACGTTMTPERVPDKETAASRPRAKHTPILIPPRRYVVKPGDTLYKIAFQYGLDHRRIAEWNSLPDPSRIRAGETLRLAPPPAKLAVSSPPPGKASGSPPPAEVRETGTADRDGERWSWPATGQLLTHFDETAGRNGIDIGGSRGSPVIAAASGQVVYAGAGLRGYGKLIIIKHSSNILTAYGHIDTILVKEGQTVARDEVVGEMGDTDAQQVKLHFEIRVHGKPVDPMQYLPARG